MSDYVNKFFVSLNAQVVRCDFIDEKPKEGGTVPREVASLVMAATDAVEFANLIINLHEQKRAEKSGVQTSNQMN